MTPPSPIGDAILHLCARPQGMRNDAGNRVLIAQMSGKPELKSTSISPRLQKFRARGLIESSVIDIGHVTVLRITEKGKRYLLIPRSTRLKPRGQSPLAKLNWGRAPMIGTPTKTLTKPVQMIQKGISCGWDCRTQMSPQDAAEFKGIWGSMNLGEYPE